MSDEKIEIVVATAKKVACCLKDPTGGKEMTPEERNRKRTEAFEDINTCIDALATFADVSESFMVVLNIRNKY